MSPLEVYENLELFVNTLTANDKYFSCNGENLLQAIQLQLLIKEKFFFYFIKSTSNLKHFEKRDDCHNLCISEITDQQILG